ncbi:VCBS repeat-containing protein [Bradyrhizobium lablabi]|uniref:FG-GAP-like repeat-containing protein n=1 Tax=Bradyrhizobium lablabi TaxID=722472 RepID=UPI001BAC178A|nr:FG-GAP-like repeat-containing protein [Bradyrhizobium lablabi]MBR1120173.1 VCBS repeat-containing protein [Bradyrhizobium lablabi]
MPEVNNLVYPYNAVCIIHVYYTYEDYMAHRPSAQGSGVVVGPDDILTAAHVIYDSIGGRPAYAIEVTPAYDSFDPAVGGAQAPFGSTSVSSYATFFTFDPDHDGNYDPGNGNPNTLVGTELDIALLHVSGIGLSQPLRPLNFTGGGGQGAGLLVGYPASQGGNPFEQTVNLTRSPVDNYIGLNATMGPGSSGGPVLQNINGIPTVVGVISTIGGATALTAHTGWLSQLIARNDDNLVGTAMADIFRPSIREFNVTFGPSLHLTTPIRYLEGGSELMNASIDGGGGIDVISLPWNSVTNQYASPAYTPGSSVNTNGRWLLTWTKDVSGHITGFLQSGSEGLSFSNIEQIAFTNLTIDLTRSTVGTQYQIGNALPGSTSYNFTLPAYSAYRVASLAGTDGDNVITGSEFEDTIYGQAGNDVLLGMDMSDAMQGGGGDDEVDGGQGDDTAIFTGNRGDYYIGYDRGTQTFTVIDLRAGTPDGTDTLTGIEHFQFADGVVATSTFAPAPNVAHDFDGDGKSDILWRNDAGTVQTWNMDGGNLLGAASLGTIPSAWKVEGTGDFNGDGKSDILWRNDSIGVAQIWDMDNANILGTHSFVAIPTEWKILDTGDFNGDGTSDILWRNDSTGVAQIWDMDNGEILSAQSLGVIPAVWKFAGTGDFNGDHNTDLLWRNDSTGVVQLWAMDDGNILSAQSLGIIPAAWKIAGAGDFNGDGKSDLLWRNDSGVTQIWNMDNGTIQSTRALGTIPSNWQVADVADFNGDSNADILWRNNTNGTTQIWEMNDGAIVNAHALGLIPDNWHIIT